VSTFDEVYWMLFPVNLMNSNVAVLHCAGTAVAEKSMDRVLAVKVLIS